MLPRHTILNFGAWPVDWRDLVRRVAAPAGIVLAWIVFFSPYLAGRRVAPGDSIDQYYPTSVFVARALADGDSPFWNPHLFAGYPAIGDPQSALWFPGFLVYNWLVGPADIRWFNVMVLLHLLMGGLSTYALLRDLGCSRFAGLAGALVFMFGGSAAGRLQHSFPISALSWFPLTFLMLRRGLAGLDWRWTLGAGVALGFLLPTALQHVALLAYALALYGWITVLRDHRGWALVKGLALLALVLASALAVALPGLAFTYQLALESIRPAVDYAITFYHAIHPKMLLTAFFPNLYGHLGGPWIGLGDKSETYVYFGIAPLVFLALALVKPRPVGFEAAFMAGLALVCVLYALGDWTPLHGLMWHGLPMLNVYRRQSEGLILLVLPMAVLTGLAWNRLETMDWTPGRRRVALGLLAALAALGPGLVGLERLRVLSFGLGPHAGATWMILACLGQMAAAVAMLWLVRAWRHPAVRPFAWGAVAVLLVADLALYNRANELNSVKRAELDRMDEFAPVLALARQAGTLADGQLWRVKPAYLEHALERLPAEAKRPHWPSTGQWWNWPALWGFQSTGGYNPVRVAPYEWLADEGRRRCRTASLGGAVGRYESELYGLLNAKYLITLPGLDDVAPPLDRTKFVRLQTQPLTVFQDIDALPRAFLVPRAVRVADDREAIARLRAPGFDPRENAVLQGPGARDLGRRDLAASAGGMHAGVARITRYRNGEVVVATEAAQAAVLVLLDVHYPGWTAELDGRPAELLRADLAFRGVLLPEGRHEVRFAFRPFAPDALAAMARDIVTRRRLAETPPTGSVICP